MTVLQGVLPDACIIDGKIFPVHTDFRNWMEIETLIQEEQGTFFEKIPKLLKLCYKKLPQCLEDALRAMAVFYMGKEGESAYAKKALSHRPLYSFHQDAELIYAAFYQQYGIDLSTISLHWWQFRSLFSGLTQKTRFMEIVSYRAADISRIQNEAEKKFYQRMKARYALENTRSKELQEAALVASLEQIF